MLISTTIITVPKMAGKMPPSVFDSRGSSDEELPQPARVDPARGGRTRARSHDTRGRCPASPAPSPCRPRPEHDLGAGRVRNRRCEALLAFAYSPVCPAPSRCSPPIPLARAPLGAAGVALELRWARRQPSIRWLMAPISSRSIVRIRPAVGDVPL